jgi:hypothetical protein
MTWLRNPAWLQAVAALASLLVTVILAVLTAVYVRHTRRMADQMARESEPVVIGRIEPFANLYAQYVLTNVGLGPALNVELRLTLDHESVWRDSLLEPGKSEFFFLPVDGGTGNSTFKALGEQQKLLKSTLSYQDRGGRTFPVKESQTDFRQLNADWDNAHWQVRKSDILQHAAELEKAIDDLSGHVKDIASTLNTHLPPLTNPTGLALSVTALRNLRHLLSGSIKHKIQPMDPLSGDHTVLAEVLEIDQKTAFRIWNHFRGHSGVGSLAEIEGVTPEVMHKLQQLFRTEDV